MLKRNWKKIIISGILLLLIVIFGGDYWVTKSTEDYTFDNVNDIPYSKVGVVLGTAKYLRQGGVNPYYKYRIDAAVTLFKAGKIDFILVSGDNRKENYNEPQTMKKDLMARGVPEKYIVLDYAGFRTLDSIVRSKEVFGQNHITVISQPFHNERAIFIAQRKHITAYGFNARDVAAANSVKVMTREKFARVKMFLDLLFNIQPKFFGPRISIG